MVGGNTEVVTEVVESNSSDQEAISHLSSSEFTQECNNYVSQMSNCHSEQEYNTLFNRYQNFVNAYSSSHPGCSYPDVPAYTVTVTENH